MKKTAVISLAQIRYFDTNEKNNVEKIKKYILKAKKAGADIVCFPETCVHKTDYLSFNHKLVKEIQDCCRENSIWTIITDTFIINKKQYKIAVLINRKGEIKGKYKKINLYDDHVKAGRKIFVYKTDFAKIGIAICWDLSNQELFKRMKKAGAEIIFCPSKWCYEQKAYDKDHFKRELFVLKSLIQSRAFENLFFVALVNPIMDKKDLVSYSAIVSSHKIISEIVGKEGIITQKIDLNEIPRVSKIYPKKLYGFF